ncbi:MAG TPA: mechanosensitive ion channel domain-containing protein [Terriglobales bacterium]|nr:mechanosensitive ion channel domain-containing protein [Terriglobales bacterium]
MKPRQWIAAAGLLILVLAAAVAFFVTRPSEETGAAATAHRRHPPLIDEHPLETARAVASSASDRDESRFAEQALKLADHEVDLAFSDGLRDASEHPVPPTPEIRQLLDRLNMANDAVQAGQTKIDDLNKQIAAASGGRKDQLQEQLDLKRAQMELDQDEQEDAKQDLLRAGGDPLSRIQRQFNRHEATQQAEASHPRAATNTETGALPDNLLAQFSAWRSYRAKRVQLQQAQDEANQAADKLRQSHDAREKQLDAEKSASSSPAQTSGHDSSAAARSGSPASATAIAIRSLHHLSAAQKDLSDLDKRIRDEEELATAYANWEDLVKSRERDAFHGLMRSLLFVALILLALYLVGRLVDHGFRTLGTERTRLHTLRSVVHFALQALAVLLIAFVVFGAPSQMPTILGLAGAGLTVALKDFIVGFAGWFVLMGRNGIRVGDWVEINGVTGEVIEITLLRTVLLETGNWADTGHPTGRKVAFVNSFAIEGHYFNFSTSGQWLWDEIEILVPSDQNPYPIIDAMQKMVAEETATNAHAAEKEWQAATEKHGAQPLSAAPAVNLRPTTAGVEVHVRYITRARERFAMRTRLYQALVDLLHRNRVEDNGAKTKSAPATASLS